MGFPQLTANKEVGPQSINCKELKPTVNQNEPGSKFFLGTSHKSTVIGHFDIDFGRPRAEDAAETC